MGELACYPASPAACRGRQALCGARRIACRHRPDAAVDGASGHGHERAACGRAWWRRRVPPPQKAAITPKDGVNAIPHRSSSADDLLGQTLTSARLSSLNPLPNSLLTRANQSVIRWANANQAFGHPFFRRSGRSRPSPWRWSAISAPMPSGAIAASWRWKTPRPSWASAAAAGPASGQPQPAGASHRPDGTSNADPDLVEELARAQLMDGAPNQVAVPRARSLDASMPQITAFLAVAAAHDFRVPLAAQQDCRVAEHCSAVQRNKITMFLPSSLAACQQRGSASRNQKTAVPKPMPEAAKSNSESLKKLYHDMLLIRRFEERAGQLYGMGLIGGFCHLYIGQEAVVVGMHGRRQAGRPADHRLSRPWPYAGRGHGSQGGDGRTDRPLHRPVARQGRLDAHVLAARRNSMAATALSAPRCRWARAWPSPTNIAATRPSA